MALFGPLHCYMFNQSPVVEHFGCFKSFAMRTFYRCHFMGMCLSDKFWEVMLAGPEGRCRHLSCPSLCIEMWEAWTQRFTGIGREWEIRWNQPNCPSTGDCNNWAQPCNGLYTAGGKSLGMCTHTVDTVSCERAQVGKWYRQDDTISRKKKKNVLYSGVTFGL